MEGSQELPLCPICCDLLGRNGGPSTLPCGHNGCLNCFLDVQSHNPCCPLCRTPFDPQQQLTLNHGLRDLISMATSIYMDESTREEGWEAFPTAKLTREHYAHEVRSEQCNQQPLSGLLGFNYPEQQQQQQQHTAANSSSSGGGGGMNVQPGAIAGAQFYHYNNISGAGNTSSSSSSNNRAPFSTAPIAAAAATGCSSHPQHPMQYHEQYHKHPGLPQSAPSGTQRDILLMEPPQWLPDSYASHCGGCHQPFKALLRLRHHCRLCGKLFCGSCSSKELLLPPRFKERAPKRVCDMCAGLLEPLQGFLVGATAASVQPPVHDALDAISLRSWLNPPWGSSMADELYKAANILKQFNEVWRLEPERGLPPSLLSGAVKGIALLSVVRLGAGWSCTAGTGIVVSRQRNGSWSAPCAAACCGVGWGLQLGGELTDVLLVLRTEEALRAFATGQTVGLGGSMGVAVGPVGRSGEVSFRLGGIKDRGAVVGYSCSKGVFAGVSLDGSVTCARDALNKRFYGYPVTSRQLLLDCSVPQPPAATLLYGALDDLMARWENRGALLAEAAATCAASSSKSSSSCSSSSKVVTGKATATAAAAASGCAAGVTEGSGKLAAAAVHQGLNRSLSAAASSVRRGYRASQEQGLRGVRVPAAAAAASSTNTNHLFDIDTFEQLEAEEEEEEEEDEEATAEEEEGYGGLGQAGPSSAAVAASAPPLPVFGDSSSSSTGGGGSSTRRTTWYQPRQQQRQQQEQEEEEELPSVPWGAAAAAAQGDRAAEEGEESEEPQYILEW